MRNSIARASLAGVLTVILSPAFAADGALSGVIDDSTLTPDQAEALAETLMRAPAAEPPQERETRLMRLARLGDATNVWEGAFGGFNTLPLGEDAEGEEGQAAEGRNFQQYTYSFKANIGQGWLKVPITPYLGLETLSSNVPRLYQVELDKKDTVTTWGFGFSGRVGDIAFLGETARRESLAVYVRGFKWSINERIQTFNPNNDTLLVPGTGDGPNGQGFAFQSFSGLNVVENMKFYYGGTSTSYGGKLGWDYKCPPKTTIGPRISIQFNSLDARQNFQADVPGYDADFRYDWQAQVDTWSLRGGVEWNRRLGSGFSINAAGGASLNSSNGDGTDSLQMNTFSFSDSQSVSLKTDRTAISWDISATLGYRIAVGTRLNAGVRYDSFTNFPTVDRDGENDSQLELENADMTSIFVGLRHSF